MDSTEKRLAESKRKAKLKQNIEFIIMVLPAVVLTFIFSYIPMFGIILAFKDYKYSRGILGSEWVGLKNFEFFFGSNDAFRVVSNTLIMNGLFIIFGTVAAVAVALLVYELTSAKFIKFFQTTLIFPHFIAIVIVAYIVYAFLNPSYGFLTKLIIRLGGPEISWYTEPKYWPLILTAVNVWQGFGFGSLLYYATLMGVDSEIFEAAKIDGANKLQQIWNISVPSLIPIIVIQFIMSVGRIFNADFGLFYQVTMNSGALYPTTDVISTYIYRALKDQNNIGLSSAVGLFQSVVGIILVQLTNWIVTKVSPENSLY